MGQVSFGHLRQPEALHPDDIDRVTASIHYVTPRADANALATTVIWAMNHKSVARTRTHAVTIEQLMPCCARSRPCVVRIPVTCASLQQSSIVEPYADGEAS